MNGNPKVVRMPRYPASGEAPDATREARMLPELERNAARIGAVADFLSSPMLVAQMTEKMELAMARCQSPWTDRQGAAAYLHCSVGEIDKAARCGVITKHMRGTGVLFLKSDLDEAVRIGKWGKKVTGDG